MNKKETENQKKQEGRILPANEQIYALIFISRMRFQKSISKASNIMARERVKKDAKSVC